MKVLVLRALMLGDLLCATPALRALRDALPGAHLGLVGLPWAQALAARLGAIDEFIALPGWPGLPEQPVAAHAARRRFVAGLRARRFDWALQLHGAGPVVNPLLAALGARRNAGFALPGGWRPEADAANFAEWPETGTEVERMLVLTDHLRVPRRGLHLDFPLVSADREQAAPLWRALRGQPFVVVHAGAQLASRRWPPERFAAVADALAEAGLGIVLTGTEAEAPLVRRVVQAMRQPALDLAGRTTLWTLGAVVERASLVVCNDTGLSHVAAALGTPSVVVSSGGDVARWAPADGAMHRVLWHDVACRPCAHAACPLPGHPCAAGVPVADVIRAALRQLPVAHHA